MTVSTQLNYTTALGDDLAVTFPFTFPVYDEDHLAVYFQDTTTLNLVLVNTADYSVTGIGNENGGNVVFSVAPITGNRVIIVRTVPLTQDLDVLNQGGFYPENIENEFDLQEMQKQQLQEQITRSVRGQITESWPNLDPPPERAGKLLGFTDDANAYPTTDVTDLLVGLLAAILVAGPGISITIGSGTITISNTSPGAEQDAWLLEDATAGGGGGSSGDAEFVRDTIALALVAGALTTITVDDPNDTITVAVDTTTLDERVRDTIGVALTAGTLITVTVNDAGDTITVAVDTAAIDERARDAVGAALTAGPGIVIAVNDAGDTITVSSEPNILTVASAATVTPTFAYDQVNITAQAAGLTIANPTGTAVDGHGILIRIKDNGTARAISWGTQYRAFNDALPTTTTISKTMYVGIVYNAADTKWDVLGVRQEP